MVDPRAQKRPLAAHARAVPPWPTVYGRFGRWCQDSTLDKIFCWLTEFCRNARNAPIRLPLEPSPECPLGSARATEARLQSPRSEQSRGWLTDQLRRKMRPPVEERHFPRVFRDGSNQYCPFPIHRCPKLPDGFTLMDCLFALATKSPSVGSVTSLEVDVEDRLGKYRVWWLRPHNSADNPPPEANCQHHRVFPYTRNTLAISTLGYGWSNFPLPVNDQFGATREVASLDQLAPAKQ